MILTWLLLFLYGCCLPLVDGRTLLRAGPSITSILFIKRSSFLAPLFIALDSALFKVFSIGFAALFLRIERALSDLSIEPILRIESATSLTFLGPILTDFATAVYSIL